MYRAELQGKLSQDQENIAYSGERIHRFRKIVVHPEGKQDWSNDYTLCGRHGAFSAQFSL